MESRQQFFMDFMSLFSAGIIFYLIRRNVIDLKYCLLGLVAAFSLVLFALFPNLLYVLSAGVGIKMPVNMLFMVGFYFLAVVVFSLVLMVSRNAMRIKTLSQEVAILKAELEKRR